jgi:hypothetical protein
LWLCRFFNQPLSGSSGLGASTFMEKGKAGSAQLFAADNGGVTASCFSWAAYFYLESRRKENFPWKTKVLLLLQAHALVASAAGAPETVSDGPPPVQVLPVPEEQAVPQVAVQPRCTRCGRSLLRDGARRCRALGAALRRDGLGRV